MMGRFLPAFIEIYFKSFKEAQAIEKCMWTEIYYSLVYVYGISIVFTHPRWTQLPAISQTTFSDAFSWKKMLEVGF